MAFRVKYSLLAQADLDTLSAWLLEQYAGEPGQRWLTGLLKSVESLREMPRRCPRFRKDRRVSFEVRQLFYGKKPYVFRILFRIDDDTVHILRIRRGQIKQPLH